MKAFYCLSSQILSFTPSITFSNSPLLLIFSPLTSASSSSSCLRSGVPGAERRTGVPVFAGRLLRRELRYPGRGGYAMVAPDRRRHGGAVRMAGGQVRHFLADRAQGLAGHARQHRQGRRPAGSRGHDGDEEAGHRRPEASLRRRLRAAFATRAAGLAVLLSLAATGAMADEAQAPGPSFDCGKVAAGSIEALVCSDAELSALDRKLAEVYAAAARKAVNDHPPLFAAEQRGWVKGRNDCWRSQDVRPCVATEYRRRIAELQARYRLVPGTGPVRFICGGDPTNEVIATFFQTDPPTLIAERGDSVSRMYQERSASGARYRGRNESLWEHQGEARVVWGYQAPLALRSWYMR